MAGGGGGGGKGRADSALNLNLTPMIDCTMLMVVFFLLTTQIADPKFTPMVLPKPHVSIAVEKKKSHQVVINVVPYSRSQIMSNQGRASDAFEYSLDTNRYSKSSIGKLSEDLLKVKAVMGNPEDFSVMIRSDYQIDYTEVEPIFAVLQQTGIAKVDVAALRTTGG